MGNCPRRRVMTKPRLLRSGITAFMLVLLPLIIRLVCGESPATHPEGNCFIIHYNSGAPLLRLIFDPLRTDWASFQARELSYLLDYFDAKFIFFCIRLHHAHFYSLSALIMLAASGMLLHYKLKRLYPDAAPGILLLIPLMYVCCFVNSAGFFRSSKPAVSFLLLWVFFNLAEMIKYPERFNTFKSYLPTAVLLLLMPYFDRIGFFVTAVCSGGSAVLLGLLACNKIPLEPEKCEMLKKPLLIFSAVALGSTALSLLYNYFIAPALVMALNGYPVSFEYQSFKITLPALHSGAVFLLQNYGGFFLPVNGMTALLSGAVIVACFTWAVIKLYRQHPRNSVIILAFVGIFTTSLICAGMMHSRHPLINELPLGSYFQVFGAALTGILAIIILELSDRKMISILLTLAVCAGITPLCRTILPKPYYPAELLHHRQTTMQTIEALNARDAVLRHKLPSSSHELIGFAIEQMRKK